jgi:hypothetical protein
MPAEDGWTSSQVEVLELAAGSALTEQPMEIDARIALLESEVAHVRSDVSDIKTDLRARFDRVDTRLDRVDTRIDALIQSVSRAQVWALMLYIALAGAILGVMARGFGWL